MSGVDDASGGDTATSEATLTELAGKLLKLREHLDQVVAELNVRREDGVAHEDLPDLTLGRGSGGSTSSDGRLLCHECGRMGSNDAAGWTLRLCGDDELHVFCRDCDHRYFNGNGYFNSNGG